MEANKKIISFSLLRKGNTEQLELFFREYFPRYVEFASKYIVNNDVCEDIVQDAFLSFWENRKSFVNIFFAKAYLYAVVKNKCMNYLRHRKVEKEHCTCEMSESLDSESSFTDAVIEQEVSGFIRAEIEKLPEMRQRVMLLALDGLSNDEIAKNLNIAVNTVKTHKSRSYEQLKEPLLFLK